MRSIKIFHITLLTLSALIVISCDPFFNCLDGNGVMEVEERIVAEFSGVENRTAFRVEVVYDTDYEITVTADENLLDEIKTYIRDDELIIATDKDRCLNSDNEIIVNIHMPDINHIELEGSGDIKAYDFLINNLDVRNSGSGNIDIIDVTVNNNIEVVLSGSGDINMYGKSLEGEYRLSGSGDLFARDFKLDICTATNSGSGDIHCYASELLKATLSGSGDIIYFGSPEQVIPEDNGSGSINSRN